MFSDTPQSPSSAKANTPLKVHCGQENIDYKAQKALLAKVDKGEISIADLKAKGRQLLDEQEPVNA